MKRGLTAPKIRMLCFVMINPVLLNLFPAVSETHRQADRDRGRTERERERRRRRKELDFLRPVKQDGYIRAKERLIERVGE